MSGWDCKIFVGLDNKFTYISDLTVFFKLTSDAQLLWGQQG